jgi:hypothetical protein
MTGSPNEDWQVFSRDPAILAGNPAAQKGVGTCPRHLHRPPPKFSVLTPDGIFVKIALNPTTGKNRSLDKGAIDRFPSSAKD